MEDNDFYSETYQLQLIAEAIRDPNFAVTVIPNLKESYFTKEWFKILFKSLNIYIEQYRSCPKSSDNFIDFIKDVTHKVKTIKVTPEVSVILPQLYRKNVDGSWVFDSNSKFIRTSINDFIKRKAMYEALRAAIDKLATDNLEEIRTLILKALTVGFVDPGIFVCRDIEPLIQTFITSREQQERILTPIADLNYYTHGGISKGELFVIMAPPNRGKTLLMNNFASWALTMKKKVVYYTLEMSEAKIGIRIVQCLGQLTQQDLLTNSAYAVEKIKSIKEGISVDTMLDVNNNPTQVYNLKDICIKFYTTKSCSVNTIYAHLALLESQGFIPDIVFVDYADLLTPLKRYTDKRSELSDIYSGLRDLAVEKNVALVTASQTNRGALSKEVIKMEDIAEDFGKVAIADVIVSINQLAVERVDGKMVIYIVKNRDGDTEKEIRIRVNYSTMTIGLVATDSDVVEAQMAQIMNPQTK
jgi:replicative DNA helicase